MAIEINWRLDEPGVEGQSGRVKLQGKGPFRIGRAPGNEVVLAHAQVSRVHAEVTVDGRTVRINDKGSQNKTYLDDKVITSATWGPDQTLRIGHFSLTYRLEEAGGQRRAVQRPSDETHVEVNRPIPQADARPGVVAPRAQFPGRIFDNRIVTVRELANSGKVAGECNYLAIGGGIGSFCWVDHLRVYGVPANDIRVIGVAPDKRPYAKWGRLCKVSQIPDHERIRSNSISVPDNIWGFPGYASRETMRELKRGNLGGLKYVLQVFGEPNLTESYTPRTGDVYHSFDVEARRIGWENMWLYGQVVGIRKTDDERFVVAYRVPSQFAADLPPEQRERFFIARYIQIATGYPASNYLPDLQEFRSANPDSKAVVNAYEEHDDVYRQLEQRGGTIMIRGRGIVASRVIQRVWEARAKNKDIRLLHLVRTPIKQGHKYDLATRDLRNDVEQQPFNWPKACWGGTLRAKLEAAPPEERARLMRDWGGTTTADRDDWNVIIETGTREGWYKVFYGNVATIEVKGARVVTRLESSDRYNENVDLTADFIVDCTGLVAKVDETPLLADLIRTYDLPRNKAAGEGAELRLAGLTVNNSFEIAGLQNGRARAWAAGVVTASGPYAAVDSFLGLQFAALRSVDQLGAIGAPGVTRFGPLRSASQWLKWCLGQSP
ncbi:MAG: FHA domain-containing protein [Hyphomicrobiaceae bacterium]